MFQSFKHSDRRLGGGGGRDLKQLIGKVLRWSSLHIIVSLLEVKEGL